MPARRPRPCLDCGTLTRNASRCDEHQAAWQRRHDQARGSSTQRGYGSAWRRTAAAAVDEHRAQYGDWCPGWGVLPHHATDSLPTTSWPRPTAAATTRTTSRCCAVGATAASTAGGGF